MKTRMEKRRFENWKAKQQAKLPPCVDRSRELLAGEVAALNLDSRKRWHPCSTGEHPAHCACSDSGNRSRAG